MYIEFKQTVKPIENLRRGDVVVVNNLRDASRSGAYIVMTSLPSQGGNDYWLHDLRYNATFNGRFDSLVALKESLEEDSGFHFEVYPRNEYKLVLEKI